MFTPIVAAFFAAGARAQEADSLKIWWVRAGPTLGFASGSGAWSTDLASRVVFDAHLGGGGSVAGGVVLSRELRLGALVSGIWSGENGVPESTISVRGLADVYPFRSPLFVTFGLGITFYNGGAWRSVVCPGSTLILCPDTITARVGSGRGPGFTLELGYALPPIDRIRVTPVASVDYDLLGNLTPALGSTGAAADWRQTLIAVGVDVSSQ